MKLGDILYIRPTFSTEYMLEDSKAPRKCRVVYIHPEGRFYVVEFHSELGRAWRESFYPHTRRMAGVADSSAPYLDDERRHI